MVRSSEVTLVVSLIPTSISFILDRTEARPGDVIECTGALYGGTKGSEVPVGGASVHIYYSTDGVFFKECSNSPVTTNALGQYFMDFTPDAVGTYTLYAEFLGNATHEGCESPTLGLETTGVKEAAIPFVLILSIIAVVVGAGAAFGVEKYRR